MVYIKRIDLKGFKTFQSKIALNFERGLTVISGPNGSGKSNIMDAMKFALGELSPKGLRGNNFEDLISKTSQRFLSNSAYVAIQFDNEDRRIPIDSDRVTISRQFHRGGEGVYRLNGKRTSRKQIAEALSSAGITVSGLNMVPQHTVTRLAEMNSEERRKIVEDMIGIGVYDSKKTEALTQLDLANINIRVASAKIEEVRSRVESLEQERNDLLRSRFLKDEVQRLKAIQISDRLFTLENEAATSRQEVKRIEDIVEKLRNERSELTGSREALEKEKTEFEQETIEEDTENLFNLEREIGEFSAELAKITYEEKARRESNELLHNQKAVLDGNIIEYRRRIEAFNKELKKLEEKRRKVESEISDKNRIRGEEVSKIGDLRKGVVGSLKELEAFGEEEHDLLKKIGERSSGITAAQTTIDINNDFLEELKNRVHGYEAYMNSLSEKKRMIEEGIRTERREIEKIGIKIEDLSSKKEVREGDVSKAFETAKKVKEALIRLQTQKVIQERIRPEEKVVQKMESLMADGELENAYGRLANLIDIPDEYRYALEVASNGWLNALVVEDLEAAIICIEILKRLKLGRMKIIPLSNVSTVQPIEYRNEGLSIIGRAVDLVNTEKKFIPAVNFIFGDTYITTDQKSALLLSLKGIRAVGVHGDLFEPDGGIESSSYRDAIDVWKLSSPDQDVKDLESMLNDLETSAHKSRQDIDHLDSEIEDLSLLNIKKENFLLTKQVEIKKIIEESDQLESSFREAKKKKDLLARKNKTLESEISRSRKNIEKTRQKLNSMKAKKDGLKAIIASSGIKGLKDNLTVLEGDVERLGRTLLDINSEITTRRSKIDVFNSNLENDAKHLEEIGRKLAENLEDEADSSNTINHLKGKLEHHKHEKSRLVQKLSKARREKKVFEHRLLEIDEQLRNSYERLEELNNSLNKANTQLKEIEMEKSFLFKDLKDLGYEKLVEPLNIDLSNLERTIKALQGELDSIGAVNQLADVQYEEYKNNYKQLSVRINELESEKLSILSFMNEIDEKKKEAFMKAFIKVQSNFSEIFSIITNGGSATLRLEDEEEPFKKGVEVFLRFPGKAEFTIEGASGGEKSVATVCFILALQAIHPMPFYLFDEIDAHLDPLNAQRLAALLKERSSGSQFIIISLKDTVISRGDKVYGVYLDSGSSRVVQLPTPEALA